MKKGWEIKKLGDLCLKITDGSHNPPKGVELSDYLMLSSRDIFDEQIHYDNPRYLSKIDFENEDKRTAIKAKDVLLTIVGTIGRVAVVPDKFPNFTLQRSVAVLRPNQSYIDSYFLKFSLQNNLDFLISESRGAAQKGIYLNQLKLIEIPIPSLLEQQEIVAILDDAFESIERAKSNAEQNLKNTKELFESYLHAVFENPNNNWTKQKLGNVCGFVRGPFGGSLKKNIFKPNGYAVYEQQHAIYDQFYDLRYFIDEKKFNEMKRFELKSGDLIMSCSGTMGKIAIVPENIKRGIINQALLKLSPSIKVSNVFLKLWMQSESFQNRLKKYAGGAAIQNVASVSILKNIEIPLPDISVQKRIVQKIQNFSLETQKIESIYQQKINDLEELKKSFLQKAFNGELKTSKISA
jgi:type I restriction enzyme S subunit